MLWLRILGGKDQDVSGFCDCLLADYNLGSEVEPWVIGFGYTAVHQILEKFLKATDSILGTQEIRFTSDVDTSMAIDGPVICTTEMDWKSKDWLQGNTHLGTQRVVSSELPYSLATSGCPARQHLGFCIHTKH